MRVWIVLGLVAAAACGGRERAKVVRVIDGDTVELDDARKLRYLLVDTPELSDSECYAAEARQFNESLVLGKRVELEYDIEPEDRYGRTLAYVYVGETMVNRVLVEQGYAEVLIIEPNGEAYKDAFLALQQTARANGVGMWGACP